MVKSWFRTGLLAAALLSPVAAEAACLANAYVGCGGPPTRSVTDAFGTTITDESTGTEVRVTRDQYGNSSYVGSDGSVMRGRTDLYGRTKLTDARGQVLQMHTDQYGTTIIVHSDGSVRRCQSDIYGSSVCW
jgi:hypothetical protein